MLKCFSLRFKMLRCRWPLREFLLLLMRGSELRVIKSMTEALNSSLKDWLYELVMLWFRFCRNWNWNCRVFEKNQTWNCWNCRIGSAIGTGSTDGIGSINGTYYSRGNMFWGHFKLYFQLNIINYSKLQPNIQIFEYIIGTISGIPSMKWIGSTTGIGSKFEPVQNRLELELELEPHFFKKWLKS